MIRYLDPGKFPLQRKYFPWRAIYEKPVILLNIMAYTVWHSSHQHSKTKSVSFRAKTSWQIIELQSLMFPQKLLGMCVRFIHKLSYHILFAFIFTHWEITNSKTRKKATYFLDVIKVSLRLAETFYTEWQRKSWKGIDSDPPDYRDVIMSSMASQITGLSSVCLTVCSGADQRKHQSSASLA